MDTVFLGIDLGTGGCRAGIFDETGNPLAFEDSPIETLYPKGSWVEQDVDEWWEALVRSVTKVVESAGVTPDQVAGIGFDATSATLVAVDSDAKPLRNAIMWSDIRAREQAARASDVDHWARRYNGDGTDSASAEWLIFKAIWLKEHEPEVWEKTDVLLDAPDWIGLRLTGEKVMNMTTASLKMYHNNDEGGFPTDFFDQIGGEGVLDKMPSELKALGETLGELTKDAAKELGLNAGTPVAVGTIDAEAGMIGMNVMAPGKMALITGSSNCLLAQNDTAIHGRGLFGSHTDALVPGQYTLEASQSAAGSVIRWFLQTMAQDLVKAEEEGGPKAFDVLNEEVLDMPPGSDGLLMTEYFQGNRSPYTDAKARGTMTGLGLHHSREHIYHAIQEATCFGLENNLRTMRSLGYEPEAMIACGGALNSPGWMQMHADVTGMDITITKVQDGPTLGSAMLGAVASGHFANLDEAAKAMVHEDTTISPDPQRHEEYKYWVEQYIAIHPAVRDIQHSIVDHVSEKDKSDDDGDAAAAPATEELTE